MIRRAGSCADRPALFFAELPADPCSETDAVYFHIRSSFVHNAVTFARKGHMLFPEDVAGVIAPGMNRCEVESYGIRVKALMRGWGVYPDMMSAVCTPYSEGKGL